MSGSLDEQLRGIGDVGADDQADAATETVARRVALYYRVLVDGGVPEWGAADMAARFQVQLIALATATAAWDGGTA